ncbi:hypothetical protein ACOSQ3_014932 [Xanthoceras sorbifolium]
MVKNWAELNHNLLVEIATRIKVYEDFVAFCRVYSSWRSVEIASRIKLYQDYCVVSRHELLCSSSWQSAAVMENLSFKCSKLPWLMLPQRYSNLRDFFDLSKGTTHQIMLPEAKGNKMCFSSKGWLITLDQHWNMNLLHPFSRITIKLPHSTTFRDWFSLRTYKFLFFMTKFVLSSNPLVSSDYVLMVIYGATAKLAYCKAGDKQWTSINTRKTYYDINYYKGQFYALDCHGEIMACDIKNGEVSPVAQLPSGCCSCLEKLYLVESEGKFLVIIREGAQVRPKRENSHKNIHATYGFLVFEVDLSTTTWTKVEDLGNRTLFLGYNSSLSISNACGCEHNCIYFTEDSAESYFHRRKGGGEDMGIYYMKDGSIVRQFMGYSPITPPMWVEQSF